VGKHGIVEDAPRPDAAVAAVVFAPCVDVLDASPGNCTAACGLTEAAALMPPVDPADPAAVADPPVAGPVAGVAVNDVDAFVEAVFDEVTSDEPAPQLPMNKPADVEQGVPGRLVPFTVVVSNAPVAEEAVLDAADVLVSNVMMFWDAPCEAIWASAAAEVASQIITEKPAMRCIEPSSRCR
jgi:hypothetical protein